MDKNEIENYYNLSNDKLNLVGKQPWSFKETMIEHFNIVESIPELKRFGISIPIESPIFVEKLAMAENDAMKILLHERHEGLVPPVMALINKSDYREIHNHLLVIFCREEHRRKLLSNWKLKRFVVDINYIFSHLGLKILRYCDRGVRVSKRAVSIVENLGESTPARIIKYECQNPRIMGEIRKAEITVKNPQSKQNVVKRARIKIKRIFEQSKKSKDPINVVSLYEGDYIFPNEKQSVSEDMIKKAKESMEKVLIPEKKNLSPDSALREDCVESLRTVIKQNAKISYKEMLIKECDSKIEELKQGMAWSRACVRNMDEMDVNKEYILKNDFSDFVDTDLVRAEQSLGYNIFNDIERPYQAFRDFVRTEKLSSEKLEKEEKDFYKTRERNYQRRKVELREDWAEVYYGLKQTALKILDLKRKLKILRIKFPKVVNYNWDIVMSDYFQNEAIKRAVKDMEHKKKNFNAFKLDKCRKQRARSIIDDFFGTTSVCFKKRKMYGKLEFKDDPKTLFIMKGLDYLMQSCMNSNYMGLAKVRIQDYDEEIPFRRFTRKGVEIRDVVYINEISSLCKRKFDEFSFEVDSCKKVDSKFGQMDDIEESELISQFFEKIKLKEAIIKETEDEIKSLKEEIILGENEIKNLMENPTIVIRKKTIDEKILDMFSNQSFDVEACSKETEKLVKKEIRCREEIAKKMNYKDKIDVLNNNLERMFNLRQSIITIKKEFDSKVNSEIESAGLLPQEISPYRKSRLEEEIGKMERYNECVRFLRSTDANNKYTKDLIIMKFLRYQTVSLNKNISVECSMEERMFKICFDRFNSEKNLRIKESQERCKERVDIEIEKRIIRMNAEMELGKLRREGEMIRELVKNEKMKEKEEIRRGKNKSKNEGKNKREEERKKKGMAIGKDEEKDEEKDENKPALRPDIQAIETISDLIRTKKDLIEENEEMLSLRRKNLELFRMKEKIVRKSGYSDEIRKCKLKRIRDEVNVSKFKINLFEALKKGEIVEEEEESVSYSGEKEFLEENINYVRRLFFRKSERINKYFKQRDEKNVERQKNIQQYGSLQMEAADGYDSN